MDNAVKAQLRHLGRPVVAPLLNRINLVRADVQELINRFGDLSSRIDSLQGRLDRLEGSMSELGRGGQLLDQLLDAVSTQNAVARRRLALTEVLADRVDTMASELKTTWVNVDKLATRIREVEERGEFTRLELFEEMRYGRAQPGSVPAEEPEIIRAEAMEMRPLKVNLGSGHIALEGYVNVDGRRLPNVDVVAPVDNLPFKAGSIDELHSAHVLEHFPTPQLKRLLSYWYTLMAPQSTFSAVLPDGETMVRQYVGGEFAWDDLRASVFGGQEYDGDFHFAMYSAGDVLDLLREAGFVDAEVVATGRPNGRCLEMEVRARHPQQPER